MMGRRGGEVLSLVERGWSGARQCSLALSRAGIGITVTHLIKGTVEPSVLRLIEPQPGIRVFSVPRFWFRPATWSLLGWRRLAGGLRWVLVDHERTTREIGGWCRWVGVTLISIRDVEGGYELWVGSQRVAFDAAFARG